MPDWIAAFVQAQSITLWDVTGDTCETHILSDIVQFRAFARSHNIPIIVCGLDAQRRAVPCAPIEALAASDIAANIAVIPGLWQPRPAALSRGSETAIAGFLETTPHYDGVVVVLSDETLWAQISAGEVISFQTFLTPELGLALSGSSGLSDAFDAALSDTLSRPDHLARHLSSAKAQGAPDRISGHLIGAELAGAKPYWLGQNITIIGQDGALYAHALGTLGASAQTVSLLDLTLAGLRLAYVKAMALPIGPPGQSN